MSLSKSDQDTCYRLLNGLQLFAASCLKLPVKVTTMEEYGRLDPNERAKIRDEVFKSSRYIDEYAELNPDDCTDEERDIIRGWLRFIRGSFIIERHLKTHSIWLSNDTVYAVQPVTCPMERIISKYALPVMVEGVILPFKGGLIFDGILYSRPIHFGGNMKRGFRETYLRAKQNDKVIYCLNDEAEDDARRPWAPQHDWSKQIKELKKTVSRFKGEKHPLCKESIGMLNASACLLETVLGAHDGGELDEIGNDYDVLVKATNRFRRALQRSET